MAMDWVKKEAGSKKIPPEKLDIPVYYMVEDDGKVSIDEEGIRDEFDRQLRLLLKKY